MAHATYQEETTFKVVTTEPAKVVLELSMGETIVLKDILSRVSGDPVGSNRIYANSIRIALKSIPTKPIQYPANGYLDYENWY